MGNKLHTNFTPLIDEVVADVGLVAATVFGVVWRYCQMDGKRCNAPLEKIAGRAHVDKRTVIRHLKVLCDIGYLRDTTPNVRNRPHEYELTEKAQVVVTATGSDDGVTESHPSPERSDRKSPHGDRESPHAVTESHPRGDRESLEETLQETSEETFQETSEGDTRRRAPARPRARASPRAKKRDPLLDHPAVIAYRDEAHRTLPAVVRPDIANAVGDDAECLAFWRRVVHDWVACGWNRENVKGMLDWFQRGELPTTAPNGRKSTRTGDMIRRTEEAAERFLAEQAGANDG